MTTDVTVIVPCYNAARYIGAALESVLNQTRKAGEILVVDDGSTDASAAVIAQYGGAVQYMRQDNQGISAARNHGLGRAQGGLIAFLDADDLWPADSLRDRMALLEADAGLGYAFGWVEPFLSPDIPQTVRAKIQDPGEARAGRLAGTLLLRRGILEKVGGFDAAFRVGETMDWVARIDAAGFSSRDSGSIVLRRRIHDANTVTKEKSLHADYLRVLRASITRRSGLAQ
ncbi:MAG: glycosyltransferase family A protein [Rhizomicrobium sp.]